MEKKLTQLCRPYIHITNTNRIILRDKIKSVVKSCMCEVIEIEGSSCATYDGLMNEFARAFEFPDYFGRNWSALDECINDLDWIPAPAYIVCVYDSENVLSKDELEIPAFFRLIKNAISEWTHGRNTDDFPDPPTPFHVIFHSCPEYNETISLLLNNNGMADFDKIEMSSISG